MTTPTRHFSAIDGRAAAGRANDALHVQLLWGRDDDVTVIVDDPGAGVTFAGTVARERAVEAFYRLFE